MPRLRYILLRFSAILLPILLCFIGLEVAVRLGCSASQDGALVFHSTRLKPFSLPANRCENLISAYLANGKSFMMYDPELGWVLRPGVSDNNAAGFATSGPLPGRERTPGKLRIVLVGDSYTQGNYATGWWRILEEQLNKSGQKAEVLNFGVGGYGMDQAYLRWHRDVAPWNPDIVIFGFFADDCYRNLNMLRLLRDPQSGIPFMKPRFVLDGTGMRLINSPTPRPEETVEAVRNIPNLPLTTFEHFFRPSDYKNKIWRHSRLAALVEAKFAQKFDPDMKDDFFNPDGEAGQVALRILRRLRQEVESAGAEFFVATMPCRTDLDSLCKTGSAPYSKLGESIMREFAVIPMESPLVQAVAGKNTADLFVEGHYKPYLHAIIGKEIAQFLISHRKH